MHGEQWVVIHSPFSAAERRMRRMLRLTVHISVLHLCHDKDIAEMCVRQFKCKTELTGPIGICKYTSINPYGEDHDN
jgi:hypothetical protein